jgi:hypothetical protein
MAIRRRLLTRAVLNRDCEGAPGGFLSILLNAGEHGLRRLEGQARGVGGCSIRETAEHFHLYRA